MNYQPQIGDIVEPTKESHFLLRSGCEGYNKAIVLLVIPFVLVSEDTTMRWESTIKPEYFRKVGSADRTLLKKCLRRIDN